MFTPCWWWMTHVTEVLGFNIPLKSYFHPLWRAAIRTVCLSSRSLLLILCLQKQGGGFALCCLSHLNAIPLPVQSVFPPWLMLKERLNVFLWHKYQSRLTGGQSVIIFGVKVPRNPSLVLNWFLLSKQNCFQCFAPKQRVCFRCLVRYN